MSEELLSPNEIGRRLRIHPETVRSWIRQGKLPAFRAGRQFRIRAADLEAFLKQSQGGEGEAKKANALAA